MIVSTNKIDLVKKYFPLFEFIKSCENKEQLANIFEIGISYIKEKHNDLSIDLKSWIVFLLKFPEIRSILTKNDEICDIIDDFVDFHKKNYQDYVNELEFSSSDYDKDEGFVYLFKKEFFYKTNLND
jgi:hypothetical protein